LSAVVPGTSGVESLVVHGATVTALARYLAPDVPWIWLLGHMPNSRVEWWKTKVPLTPHTQLEGQVRGLTYDVQLATAAFLDHAVDLDEHGIYLVQSHCPMPDTLDLRRVSSDSVIPVLKANGAFLTLELPHAVETAVVTSFVPGYLARFSGT
jgi:hypothetical protein